VLHGCGVLCVRFLLEIYRFFCLTKFCAAMAELHSEFRKLHLCEILVKQSF